MLIKKNKILWLCNVAFSDSAINTTGTWLYTMANAINSDASIQLFNISKGPVSVPTSQDFNNIKQWVMPNEKLSDGLPGETTIAFIQKIVAEVQPDVIHIWGIENYWGLLSARGFITGTIILDIQGIKHECAKYYTAGLSLIDVIRCFTLKDVFRPKNSIIGEKRMLADWGKYEKEILLKHKIISTQSNWTRSRVKHINPDATTVETAIKLRPEFLNTFKWSKKGCNKNHIFTITSSMLPYKGLHDLVDAISLLKKKFPDVMLSIVGSVIKSGIHQDGYTKWLFRKIRRYGLVENIIWEGALGANELVNKLVKANICVIPSYIESYCVAMDESLALGVPTIASYSGAMPELATDGESAIFYPAGDVLTCASIIERLLESEDLASRISKNALKEKSLKNEVDIKSVQLAIYNQIMNENP